MKTYPPAPRCGHRQQKGDVLLLCSLARGHDDPNRPRVPQPREHRYELPPAEKDAVLAVREVRRGMRAALADLLSE